MKIHHIPAQAALALIFLPAASHRLGRFTCAAFCAALGAVIVLELASRAIVARATGVLAASFIVLACSAISASLARSIQCIEVGGVVDELSLGAIDARPR
jgi:hypothetical protein